MGIEMEDFILKKNTTVLDRFDSCESKKYVSFRKGDIILTLNGSGDTIGMLQEGKAYIACIDADGQESVFDFLRAGDCFGEYIITPLESIEYIAMAETDCRVLFMHFDKLLHPCRADCKNHNELIKRMLVSTSEKAKALSLHVSILNKKSLREKLIAYFEYQKKIQSSDSDTIIIPITFERLAKYLGTNRSAMMREIKRMNDDGIINSNGKRIDLIR